MNDKYTVSLKKLLDNPEVKPLIDKALSTYPLYEPSHKIVYAYIPSREELNKKILNAYKYREIGFETVGRFIDELEISMMEIMPYYNSLYKSIDMMNELDNIFENVDIEELFDEQREGTSKGSSKGSSEGSSKGSSESNNNSEASSESKTNSNVESFNKNVESQTPQNDISTQNTEIDRVSYADKITWNHNNSNDSATNKGSDTTKSSTDSKEELAANAKEIRQRLYALFAVLGIAAFFWFAFHQNGQSLSVFARDFVLTNAIPPEIWQCINPFFVITLTPIIMWAFAALARKGKEVSTPRKIAIGMLITATAYIFLAGVAMANHYPSGVEFRGLADAVKESMKASPYVLILTYFFLTVAELFISPLGLSFVSKVAPKHLQGICQGLWLTATAIGNLFIAIGVTMLNTFPHQWMCWAVFAGICLVSMGIMFGMVRWLEEATK